MIFTSGTTGPPKGALHGHRVLLGHLPGFQMAHEFPPQPDDLMWTPADWAWAGGLLNALLPSLYLGVPVVSARFEKFDPETALSLMAKMRVQQRLHAADGAAHAEVGRRHPRSASASTCARSARPANRSGARPMNGPRTALGITLNEFYGQTECNFVLGSCAALGVSRAGAIGKVVPGHRVAIIDAEGRPVPAGRDRPDRGPRGPTR